MVYLLVVIKLINVVTIYQSHDNLPVCTDSCLPSFQQSLKEMKAIRIHQFGGPEVLKFDTNVPIPKCEAEDVLVRVKSIGINPVETYIRAGQYARLPSLPFTPGHDCAGIVEDVGSSVTTFKKGQRVWTSRSSSGAYAEFSLSHVKYVHPLPDELSFAQGAALSTPYLTAYRALITRANARPGELVLIHGASGGVGSAAVQFARAYGMRVIGTAGTEEGLSLVQQAGAHHTFNHRYPNYIDEIKNITGTHGVDVVIENAAHINLGNDLTLLAMKGRVAVVGSRGPIEVIPRDTMSRESSILGVMLFGATEKELEESYAAIQAGIKNKWLTPIIGKEFSLENASDAHHDIIHGKGALGKMVLNVD